MRIAFMGTPDFAARILARLADEHDVACVFTRADAVRGRGKALLPSPVKEQACARGIEVHTVETLRDGEAYAVLESAAPDAICVAAYGMIIPKEILELPRFGCLNVHASILPRWRGAAPVERAILAGDEEAGVSIMRMEEGLDTGAYCECVRTQTDGKTCDELTEELARLGADALCSVLRQLEQGEDVEWVEQDETRVTYAHKIERGELDFGPDESATAALRKVRASSESHPSTITLAEKSVCVQEACIADDGDAQELATLEPGQARYFHKKLYIRCSEGLLQLVRVKPAGKSSMDASAFAAGIQGSKANILAWRAIR